MTLLAVAFALGLVVGSFLNVVIVRLPLGASVVRPRSRCTRCGRALRWYENVPVLSWLALRARCAGCGERIPVMYPLVELVTGLAFAAAAWLYGATPLFVVRCVFVSALIVLFVIDLQHRILPNAITLPGIVVGVLCSIVLPPGLRSAIIGVIAGGGIPLLIAEAYYRWRGEEGLGMGDVKMLAMIGAFLGWPLMLLTLFLASLLGSTVGVGAMLVRGRDLRYALPFGTFLAIGAVVATVLGDPVIEWYLRFYE